MWVYVLFITVIAFVPDEIDIHVQTKVLKVLSTPEECSVELKRIEKDLNESYPGHNDWRLTCEKREKIEPKEQLY